MTTLTFSTLFWLAVTRLGEAQILLPAMLAASLWLAWRLRAPRVAALWLVATGLAAGLTTVTKLAFIGWGIGYAPWDFTGISGHAMFAAAVLPVLARTLASVAPSRWAAAPLMATTLGYGLAALIAVSRVMVQAHSESEAIAGFVTGALASGLVLAWSSLPRASLGVAVPALVLLWMVVTPGSLPRSRTHDMVTWVALKLSDRPAPYTRIEMLRDWNEQRLLQQRSGRAAGTGRVALTSLAGE